MTGLNMFARMCLTSAAAATLCASAGASVVLHTDAGAMSAVTAIDRSSGQPQRATWDLATMKGARSSGAPQPMTVILEKVSIQDFHRLCPAPAASSRALGGVTAMDDWESPACKSASATVEDSGKTYILSDVSLVGRPTAGCDHACTTGDVTVSFMAINEKGSGGNNGSVKKSAK